MDLQDRFHQYDNDFAPLDWFDQLETKLASRPDIHAYLILDKLLPYRCDIRDMVSAAEHDQIWLNVNIDELNDLITDEQIFELSRCGVFYDDEVDSLSMFV